MLGPITVEVKMPFKIKMLYVFLKFLYCVVIIYECFLSKNFKNISKKLNEICKMSEWNVLKNAYNITKE